MHAMRFLLPLVLALACSAGETANREVELGDHRYSVRLAMPPTLSVAGEGFLDIRVRPKEGRKLSLEFPTRVEISPHESVEAPARMDKEAAAVLTEAAIDYQVPLRPIAAGAFALEGRLQVGVCTDEICERVELPFQASVSAVQAAP